MSALNAALALLETPPSGSGSCSTLPRKISSLRNQDWNLSRVIAVFILLSALFASTATAQTENKELIAKGEAIFSLAGGCACHSDPRGKPHTGGRAFPVPFGTVYSTNLTADKETGLGLWTDQQIADAITKGIRRDGSRSLPVMPYGPYSGIAQDDLKALIVFLRTLSPLRQPTPDLQTSVPMLRSVAAEAWLKAFGHFFTSTPTAPKSGIERGKYLTEHVAICGDCHTPRSSLGVPNRSMDLAGAAKDIGPLGERVPNITPDRETGIGNWNREEIADLLISGTKPDLDYVRGLMYDVIQGSSHGYRHMSRTDALAIADYIKSIPPIKNKIQ